MDNKYCPSCAVQLDVEGKGGNRAKFRVITVRRSHTNEAQRRQFAKNKPMSIKALEWVVTGGDPPPAYKPATVVGRNAGFSSAPILNLLTGRSEFLLVPNDPGSFMRRLLGMTTMRVCETCYNDKFKAHPQQLQKAD